MKIRVSLREQTRASNVIITADGTATVGDVAVAIASAGKESLAAPPDGLTLRLFGESHPTGKIVNPGASLAESGVQNGMSIEVVSAAGQRADERAVAELRVVGGPDSGVTVGLRAGTSTVGRKTDEDVRLSDSRVSSHHARIIVGDRVEIIDDNSSNGVFVGERRVGRAILGAGDVAVLGETRITVAHTEALQAVATATADVQFIRSPRVLVRPQAREVGLPDVPGVSPSMGFPWVALVAPLVMGVGLYFITRSLMSMAFVALSPVLMIGTYLSSRMDTKRTARAEEALFRSAVADADSVALSLQEEERAQLLALYPSVRECVDATFVRGTRLWSRRPEHPEFLRVRLGLGAVPSGVTFDRTPTKGRVDLLEEIRKVVAARGTIDDAPIIADLAAVGGVGIVGRIGVREGVARAIVAQIAALHSPAEVTIACLTSTASKDDWSWLEWLPHTSVYSPLGGTQLAAEAGSGRRVLDRLEELVATRSEPDSAGQQDRGPLDGEVERVPPILPSVLVVVHNPSVDWARIATLAERGPDVGVHFVWIADTQQSLPGACRTVVDLGDGSSTSIGMVRTGTSHRAVTTESLDPATSGAFARKMAPMMDAGFREADDSDLPQSVSMVSMIGVDEAEDPQAVLTRWRENGSYVDRDAPPQPKDRPSELRALVGHAGVEPFTLDLRSQGPHALVGGTTGSGKSEFLQAWVLGMAHAYSPDRVTLLFVDYKGGAAFAECVDLPHCVGMVTDLSPYLVQRALRSLKAEIHRRERLLNEKGMKDLIDLEKSGDHDCPPSLIIVVDEFAALKDEVPEFVEGVIDVAQRGRSLGLHLIMATQRPSGVIDDRLRANTNLRIALRMNDEHDSTDVLGDKVAAHFDPATPGRGSARTGPARITTFQSAFPGARTSAEPPPSPIHIAESDFGALSDWNIPAPPRPGDQPDKDLNRLVRTVAAAARLGRVPPPRRPWLEALAPAYDLALMKQKRDSELVLGAIDDPDNQAQTTEYFYPDENGNLLYYGAGGSGKSTALRSLGVAASITPASGPVHVYGLDFAGGALRSLQVLPNVGDIVGGDDEERVQRLLRKLVGIIDARSDRYKAIGAASLTDFRRLAGEPDEPRVLLLLDGYASFRSEYETPADRQASYAAFLRTLSKGRQFGVHVAMSADSPVAVPAGVTASFTRRIVLRQADADSYASLGVPSGVLNADSPPGRAMQAGIPKELQIAILGGSQEAAEQSRKISEWASVLAGRTTFRPEPIGALPDFVPAPRMPSSVRGEPVLGILDETLEPVGFAPQGTIVIAGPPQSGKTVALKWLAHSVQAAYPSVRLMHLAGRKGPLSGAALWSISASGQGEIEPVLDVIESAVSTPGDNPAARVALFLDGVVDMSSAGYEPRLAEIVAEARRNGHLVVGEDETNGWRGSWSIIGSLKSSRTGLLLRPDQHDGESLLQTPLPRTKPATMPPGRGFWVKGGRAWKVQIPIVE